MLTSEDACWWLLSNNQQEPVTGKPTEKVRDGSPSHSLLVLLGLEISVFIMVNASFVEFLSKQLSMEQITCWGLCMQGWFFKKELFHKKIKQEFLKHNKKNNPKI